ncbi:helix-turn-helix domain-containing protein [Herbiconiux sp. YIM B11900]|uniref:helix-turn-helix domain-containing protein n=1 Tax=Herbiconiux sp. YIM B11900 TaxID=3404131 RepID=UPI003F870524
MDVDTPSLAAAIGERIRRERQAREWTLDRLSEAAEVSRRQLVNVEQGEANPSIGTLLALSDALGISLAALVEPPTARLVKIHRSGEGAELWAGAHGGRAVLLIGTQPPDVVNLWDWRMNPGERHESRPHPRGCREVLHVVAGTVTLDVAEDRYVLGPDDSITFPGDVAHAYSNESGEPGKPGEPGEPGEPAHFSLTVYQPQSSAARETHAPDA